MTVITNVDVAVSFFVILYHVEAYNVVIYIVEW